MREPNIITSNFYSINQDIITRKSELIDNFPKLKSYNYHLGLFREELIKTALKNSLQGESLKELDNIQISSGFIKDSCGNLSNQIDILIFPKDCKSFKYGMFDVIDIQNAIAAIEIKSKIDKSTMFGKQGALNNIASIRKLEENNNCHVFTAIVGFESIRDKKRLTNYLSEFYKPIFDSGIKEFCDKHNSTERTDLATKLFTPDLIVSLDNLLLLFGTQSDLLNFLSRPAVFSSKPKVKGYTSLQYLYFELLSYILIQSGLEDKSFARLFDYLNFDSNEKDKGYSIDSIMGIDWDNYKFLN